MKGIYKMPVYHFRKLQYGINMECHRSLINFRMVNKKMNKITPGNVNHTQLIFIQSIIHCTKLSISICIHAYL